MYIYIFFRLFFIIGSYKYSYYHKVLAAAAVSTDQRAPMYGAN